MPLFTKESLETLRDRIDLVEVLEPHLELKKAGIRSGGGDKINVSFYHPLTCARPMMTY